MFPEEGRTMNTAAVSVAKADLESKSIKAKTAKVDRTNEREPIESDRIHQGAKVIIKVENLERYMARLVGRIQALEAIAGRPVYDETSEHVVKKARRVKSVKAETVDWRSMEKGPERKAAKKAAKAAEVNGDGEVEVEESIKPARVKREYTDEERKAIGVRLQTARAKNLGLTYDEFKEMRLRPGAKPTTEQMAAIRKARKSAKAKATK